MFCNWIENAIQLAPLTGKAPGFFGFQESLAGLALMAIAWTIADQRYRFRLQTAPFSLFRTSFIAISAICTVALLTELWRAEAWPLPLLPFFTQARWEFLLAFAFLLIFFSWAYFAFIRPPRFTARNAERFTNSLGQIILRGSPTELAEMADEITRSAEAIIYHAPLKKPTPPPGIKLEAEEEPTRVQVCADDILLLMADKRFCRAIVASSPGTALAIFRSIQDSKKFGVNIGTFGRNIVREALENKDSFLFHETEGYETGLLGYFKPLSQAIFSNYPMVEEIGTLLDPNFRDTRRWDPEQWEAYCRVTLITLKDYIANGSNNHSSVLYRAIGDIAHATSDLHTLNETAGYPWDDRNLEILRVVMGFFKDATKLLGEDQHSKYEHPRPSKEHVYRSIYDYLADAMLETIANAASVTAPRDFCWSVQHNSLWREIFGWESGGTRASRLILFKVRRLLFDKIKEMEDFPNFLGAKVLGLCLNVMGFKLRKDKLYKYTAPLHKAVLTWTRKNFASIYKKNTRVADACLVDGISYDPVKNRLVQTWPVDGLRTKAHFEYLNLDEKS